jgi:hypothetical protein
MPVNSGCAVSGFRLILSRFPFVIKQGQ